MRVYIVMQHRSSGCGCVVESSIREVFTTEKKADEFVDDVSNELDFGEWFDIEEHNCVE